jgi:hypothetical protein
MRSSGVRGVSDVVSFTLVFSTIIFMIGVVTVTGVGTLGDIQAGTESNVAEATMRNYASSLADHRTQSAPRRSTTIKLQGHKLEHVDSTLNWSVDGGSETGIQAGAIVRTTDTDARFIYESGGLFRAQDGGTVVVRPPPVRCGDTAHISVVVIRDQDGDVNIASDNRVTLQSTLVGQHINATDANQVTVYTGSTANAPGWNDSLEGDWTQSGTNEYECTNVDRVVVHRTTVELDVVN